MYSKLFCGTLETQAKDINHIRENDRGINLYKIKLSKYQDLVTCLNEYLTASELNRGNRYYHIKDKNRFIICRTLLKFLLSEQTGLEVKKIFIEKHDNKKPYLRSNPSVFFNVTHAGDYAVIAIANSSIGVDIEYVNKDFDYKEILPSVFSKPEIDKVSNSIEKHRTFYRLWTRKEAIVKATGIGIDDYISEIISLDGYHNIRPELLGNLKSLKVFSFELDESYIGAVAISDVSEHMDKLSFYPIPQTFQELRNSK